MLNSIIQKSHSIGCEKDLNDRHVISNKIVSSMDYSYYFMPLEIKKKMKLKC